MTPTGLEHQANSPANPAFCSDGGANSVALSSDSSTDPDLRKVMDAWQTLPVTIRAAFVAMIGTTGK